MNQQHSPQVHREEHIYVLVPVSPDHSDAQESLPIAALVRIKAQSLLDLAHPATNALANDDLRWLSALAFDSQGLLAPVPGFAMPDEHVILTAHGIQDIDEDANGGNDLYPHACTVFDGEHANAVLRTTQPLQGDTRLYISSDVQTNGQPHRRIRTADIGLHALVSLIRTPGDTSSSAHDQHFRRYSTAVHGSNAMVRALLEEFALNERVPGESLLAYIERITREDFAAGKDCIFPDIYADCAPAAAPSRPLHNYVVLFRDAGALAAAPPLGFQCDAEDSDHAQEQCENAYPGCDVVWVWQGPKGVGVEPALQDYWGNSPRDSIEPTRPAC